MRMDRQAGDSGIMAWVLAPGSESFPSEGAIDGIREEECVRLFKRIEGRGLYSTAVGTRNHYGNINIYKTQKTIALEKDAGGSDPLQREPDSPLCLSFRRDNPVNIRGSGVPQARAIFSRLIVLIAPGADHRCAEERIPAAAQVRISSAMEVVVASELYCFPAGESLQQFTDERRFACIRRKTTHGDGKGFSDR
jgi:hypothetical protein